MAGRWTRSRGRGEWRHVGEHGKRAGRRRVDARQRAFSRQEAAARAKGKGSIHRLGCGRAWPARRPSGAGWGAWARGKRAAAAARFEGGMVARKNRQAGTRQRMRGAIAAEKGKNRRDSGSIQEELLHSSGTSFQRRRRETSLGVIAAWRPPSRAKAASYGDAASVAASKREHEVAPAFAEAKNTVGAHRGECWR